MSEQLSTALVTGGSRGIGKAIAETLAKAGYQVYLTYVSKADAAEAVARNIVAAGGKACAFRLDVADAEAVAAFIYERLKDQVELDVLVDNAGITNDGLLQRIHRHGAGHAAAARTAHTVAHGTPRRVVRAAPPPVAVLVFAALAADICFSDKLHAGVPPFASRRSWPQAALMSVPRRRRSVAVTLSCGRSV